MKIATYNILNGGSNRVHWSKMIEEHGVDLLLVQESSSPEEHLRPLLYPDLRKQSIWELAEHNKWGSAIFSSSGSLKQISVPRFTGWVVGAEVIGANWLSPRTDSILVFSVHAPKRTENYQRQVNNVLDDIGSIANGQELIVGGDFNLTISNSDHSE